MAILQSQFAGFALDSDVKLFPKCIKIEYNFIVILIINKFLQEDVMGDGSSNGSYPGDLEMTASNS